MKKIALIGIGAMGGGHYNCYKNIENAEVIAVADVRTEMAKEKVENENIHIYSSLDELLKNEKPDIADICTPSYMHREMSIKCLEAGINVLCEKPMSLSSKDTAEIIKAAEKSGKLFMTAHVVRFMTPFMFLKKIIDSKELGEPLRIDMKRMSKIPLWTWDDWMRDLKRSGGTPFDFTIHDIDFVQYVLGQPKEVSAVYHKMRDDNDYIVSQLIYDNCIVSAECGWYKCELEFMAEYNAIFENGNVRYSDGKVFKNGEEIKLEAGEISENLGINLSGVDGYAAEIRYFIHCVENGIKPELVTPESSQNSIKLIERILENAIII